MKINCIDKEIQKILETGYYVIPRFQRPYSWDKDNIDEFWNDSVMENENDYFIGSIVVYKTDGSKFGIVDGQQRLTTITMILCALRDAYIKQGFRDNALGVHNLIERVDLYNKKQFILQTETSYPYFQEHIQKIDDPEIIVKLKEEEINLEKGFEIINNYITAAINDISENSKIKKEKKSTEIEKQLNHIRDRILGLKVIYIELDDEDDAYVIFETLNTRGKDLNVSDLVKNYLTKLIKVNNANVDLAKDKWSNIRTIITGSSNDIDIDTFIHQVWLSKYEFTTLKTLYKKIKKQVKKANAKTFLDELTTDAETYRTIIEPSYYQWNKNDWAIKESLEALNLFRVTQQMPMVLSIMREYKTGNLKPKHTLEILQSIEYFHYVFTAITSQRSSGGISMMYSSSARELYLAGTPETKILVIRQLQDKMRAKLPSQGEFVLNFQNLTYTNQFTKQKKLIQYSLKKINQHLDKGGVSVDYDKMTIEHIASQSKGKANGIKYYGTIGNLLLVDKNLNGSLDAKDFTTKHSKLTASKVFLDEIISKASKWEDQEIRSRGEFLGRLAFEKVFHF